MKHKENNQGSVLHYTVCFPVLSYKSLLIIFSPYAESEVINIIINYANLCKYFKNWKKIQSNDRTRDSSIFMCLFFFKTLIKNKIKTCKLIGNINFFFVLIMKAVD